MINGNFFEISFPEVIPNLIGNIVEEESRTFNYYADNGYRKTMCCNCDKKANEGPDQTA
jgi:hypothetical protein